MPIDSSLVPFGQVFRELCPFEGSGLPRPPPRPALSLDSALSLLPHLQTIITFSSHLRLRCSLALWNHNDTSLLIPMSIPSWLLVSVGERRLQRPGSLPTLGPLGSPHQRHPKARASLRCPPWALGVAGTPQGEVRDTHPHLTESMPSSTILKVGHTNSQVAIPIGAALCFHRARPPQCTLKFWQSLKGVVTRWSI